MKSFSSYHSDKKMTYEDGLMLLAAERLASLLNDKKYLDFNLSYLDSCIGDDGTIFTYNLEDYNIDNILAGNALFRVARNNNKYEKALNTLERQLDTHPRTSTSNYFHKNIYPYQIWLDGLYMGLVFRYRIGILRNDEMVKKDVINQLKNVSKIMFVEKEGLYMHAFDETHSMQWADKKTGLSHLPWSRSIGWMLMALIDIYELIDSNDVDDKLFIKDMLKDAVDHLIPFLDQKTKMMYQIVNLPNEPKNYLETSGSAMLSYTLQKAYNLHVLDETYSHLALDIFKGIISTYFKKEEDGLYYLDGICKVAGLDNKKRDGSIAYYLSEPITKNEIKGVGPFIFAFIELAKKDKSILEI
jgi:unsaturated rhamnogalacturonyl hydrolase